ncbi:MAG: ribonuclease HII, partial [Thaumarchaeota archaeon]
LSDIGVKDSKQLTPRARKNLYKKIIDIADGHYVAKISPRTIDRSVIKNELNQLEAKYMAKVISKLRPDSAYVDSCDVNPGRFGRTISKLAKTRRIHSSHHADKRFPVVSAASIVAKVNRDRAIEKLRHDYDIGSGYPSDRKTMEFIKRWVMVNHSVPKFVRKSWKPVKIMLKGY